MAKVQKLAFPMLEEWDRTKVPPKQTAWLHEKELGNDRTKRSNT
jgi:hypothetical protein